MVPSRRADAPRAPFVVLVVLLLAGGVAGLLALQHHHAAGRRSRRRRCSTGPTRSPPGSSRWRWSSSGSATRSSWRARAKKIGHGAAAEPGLRAALRRQGARPTGGRHRARRDPDQPAARREAEGARARSRASSRSSSRAPPRRRSPRRTAASPPIEPRGQVATGLPPAAGDEPLSPAPRSRSRRPVRPGAGRGVGAHPAAGRSWSDRDGGLGLRRPAVPAPGPRPEGVRRARQQAEGAATVVLPATARHDPDRNGVALAESVDGLMLIADPKLHRRSTRGRSPRSSPTGSASTTSTCSPSSPRRAASSPTPVPVRRPPGALDQGPEARVADHRRRAATRASTPGATRCATTRPSDVARQPGRLHRRQRRREGGRADVRQAAHGQGRLSRPTRSAAATGSRSATTARCRAAQRHDLQLTIDRDVQWYTQRVLRSAVQSVRQRLRLRGRAWTPTPASCSRSPTTRRTTPTRRPTSTEERPRQPGAARRLRARLGGEGAHDRSLLDAGKVTPRTRSPCRRSCRRRTA